MMFEKSATSNAVHFCKYHSNGDIVILVSKSPYGAYERIGFIEKFKEKADTLFNYIVFLDENPDNSAIEVRIYNSDNTPVCEGVSAIASISAVAQYAFETGRKDYVRIQDMGCRLSYEARDKFHGKSGEDTICVTRLGASSQYTVVTEAPKRLFSATAELNSYWCS